MTTATVHLSAGGWRARVIELWNRVFGRNWRRPHRLRLCESLALGERRFVAVVQFEDERFLVGGTPSSLVLLSRLEGVGNRERGAVTAGETAGEAC